MAEVIKNIKLIIIFILAILILNTGLIAQDLTTNLSANQNIINSVTEYVAEVLLNKGNVFPENHNTHHQKQNKQSHNSLFKVQQSVLFRHYPQQTVFAFNIQETKNKYVIENDIRLQNVISEITPRPPQA